MARKTKPTEPPVHARIKALVDASDMTQGQLAARAGITRTALNRILNGAADPKLSHVRAILAALGQTLTLP
jgi:transcriptional regulator with XRE-family HTH domain